MTQGGRAVSSGNVLESAIEGALVGHGYSLVGLGLNIPKRERLGLLLSCNNLQKRYARQVYIGQGIYDTDIYVDFYVIGSSSISSGLIIECKWQQTGGSVDEKLPYLNLNIQYCYPVPAIVLIDGGGMKPKAVTWLSRQTALNQNLIAVHDISSFIKWSNNNF